MLSKKWSMFSILLYIIFGIIFDDFFLRFHKYGSYIFDSVFVLFFLIKATSFINFKGAFTRYMPTSYFISFLLGFLVYKAAIKNGIPIPFNLNGLEVLFFLLLIGPILEEFIFRFCIQNLSNSFGSGFLGVIISSALFSLSHFMAYFSVPNNLSSFVIYQTIYTFLIGLWWSISYLRTKSITVPVLLHIFFNFGFYLGSQFGFIRL